MSAVPSPVSEPSSRDDAEMLVAGILATIERMDTVLREETELVRGARLSEAASLVEAKAALAGTYQRELEAVRAAAGVIGRLLPDRAAELRRALASLQASLALNLAVVGTAKAVAEDMMRSVAEDVARRDRPRGYGPAGVATRYAGAPAPVSISRRS